VFSVEEPPQGSSPEGEESDGKIEQRVAEEEVPEGQNLLP
jgi:hypothetical protein